MFALGPGCKAQKRQPAGDTQPLRTLTMSFSQGQECNEPSETYNARVFTQAGPIAVFPAGVSVAIMRIHRNVGAGQFGQL